MTTKLITIDVHTMYNRELASAADIHLLNDQGKVVCNMAVAAFTRTHFGYRTALRWADVAPLPTMFDGPDDISYVEIIEHHGDRPDLGLSNVQTSHQLTRFNNPEDPLPLPWKDPGKVKGDPNAVHLFDRTQGNVTTMCELSTRDVTHMTDVDLWTTCIACRTALAKRYAALGVGPEGPNPSLEVKVDMLLRETRRREKTTNKMLGRLAQNTNDAITKLDVVTTYAFALHELLLAKREGAAMVEDSRVPCWCSQLGGRHSGACVLLRQVMELLGGLALAKETPISRLQAAAKELRSDVDALQKTRAQFEAAQKEPKSNACVACKFESEFGTEECPHPVDERIHDCEPLKPSAPPEPSEPPLEEVVRRLTLHLRDYLNDAAVVPEDRCREAAAVLDRLTRPLSYKTAVAMEHRWRVAVARSKAMKDPKRKKECCPDCPWEAGCRNAERCLKNTTKETKQCP